MSRTSRGARDRELWDVRLQSAPASGVDDERIKARRPFLVMLDKGAVEAGAWRGPTMLPGLPTCIHHRGAGAVQPPDVGGMFKQTVHVTTVEGNSWSSSRLIAVHVSACTLHLDSSETANPLHLKCLKVQ